jgi:hypothetical protein
MSTQTKTLTPSATQVWCADCEAVRESTGETCGTCGSKAIVNAMRLIEGTCVEGVYRWQA